MARFFKREERRPFNYPAIEEYKGGSKHIGLYIGLAVIIILIITYLLIFR